VLAAGKRIKTIEMKLSRYTSDLTTGVLRLNRVLQTAGVDKGGEGSF